MRPRQCKATTNNGKQCKRDGKGPECVCYQHDKPPALATVTRPVLQVTASLDLLCAHKSKLRRSALRKLETKLRKGPPSVEKDGLGAIYIYYLETDRAHGIRCYWKVGMTKHATAPGKRIKQWSAKQEGVVTQAVYVVERGHKFIERVVHLYLDHCRMYRYPCASAGAEAQLFRSTWYATGLPVKDAQWDLIDLTKRTVARQKSVEWFCGSLEDIEGVVQAVIKLCSIYP